MIHTPTQRTALCTLLVIYCLLRHLACQRTQYTAPLRQAPRCSHQPPVLRCCAPHAPRAMPAPAWTLMDVIAPSCCGAGSVLQARTHRHAQRAVIPPTTISGGMWNSRITWLRVFRSAAAIPADEDGLRLIPPVSCHKVGGALACMFPHTRNAAAQHPSPPFNVRLANRD